MTTTSLEDAGFKKTNERFWLSAYPDLRKARKSPTTVLNSQATRPN
jgi:hypothetical protein